MARPELAPDLWMKKASGRRGGGALLKSTEKALSDLGEKLGRGKGGGDDFDRRFSGLGLLCV